MKKFRIILLVLGALLTLDTLVIAPLSNYNLGVILPAIIGFPLLLMGIFYNPLSGWTKRSRLGAIVKWAVGLAYGIGGLALAVLVSLMLAATLDQPAPGADAVIVLGAGLRGDRVPVTLAARLKRAAEYAQPNPETVFIVTGGQGRGEWISEAQAMKDYLVSRLGVLEERILMEDRATSTQENFRYSLPIINEHVGEDARVVFVTNAFHMFRSELVARKEGVRAEALGCPTTWYLIPNNYLREAVAIAAYFITGRF